MRDNSMHMMHTVHVHRCDMSTQSYYTAQLQVWDVHCPISAEIWLVITNHIWEFCYSFD